MKREELDSLKISRTYLIKRVNTVSSITMMAISEKAIQVRWNVSNSTTWELKDDFMYSYSFVEDITDIFAKLEYNDFIRNAPKDKYSDENCHSHPYFITYEICPTCGGEGTIYNNTTTAGVKICPLCCGTKRIPKKVSICF